MTTHETHTLYDILDFTPEEIAQKNLLAVMVVEHDNNICKQCGGLNDELVGACKAVTRK